MVLDHLSREKAETYVGKEPYGVISITDPGEPEANLQPDPKRVAVLRLAFHDFTQEPEEFAALLKQSALEDLEPQKKWVLPTAEHAWQIVTCYRSLPADVEKVLIHCEAGVSRSAAVGAALAHCLRQTDAHFYHHSHPNHRVRRLVIEAWGRRE